MNVTENEIAVIKAASKSIIQAMANHGLAGNINRQMTCLGMVAGCFAATAQNPDDALAVLRTFAEAVVEEERLDPTT